jgi:hypothetical protein
MNGRKALTAALATGVLLALPASAAAQSCGYGVDREVDRRVRMSEVHGWTGVSATFEYAAGRAADTYVGFAIQDPKGVWKAGGTDHVTSTKVFGQTATVRGRGSRYVSGVFHFNILKQHGRRCPRGTIKGFTRATRFEGGMRLGKRAPRGLSGRCNKAPGRRKLFPDTSVFTSTARSRSYDRAFTLLGVTLGSTTSYSSNAQIKLENHSRRAVWVCGSSQSGRPVPIADATMLYAGPRVR